MPPQAVLPLHWQPTSNLHRTYRSTTDGAVGVSRPGGVALRHSVRNVLCLYKIGCLRHALSFRGESGSGSENRTRVRQLMRLSGEPTPFPLLVEVAGIEPASTGLHFGSTPCRNHVHPHGGHLITGFLAGVLVRGSAPENSIVRASSSSMTPFWRHWRMKTLCSAGMAVSAIILSLLP